MQNYHRHSSFSNIMTADSVASNEEYAKRAVELGHKIISSVEHGWQGYYHQTYELAKKYDLKCVIGAEAYWVKDRLAEYDTVDSKGRQTKVKDRSNHHIILLAKNNHGRECLNDVLSEASISGYYYRPRVDLPLLMSLPPDDIFVTSACIAFKGYEDIDDIILQLHDHFKDNFMLEVQYHLTDKQREWNKHLVDLSQYYGIELIAGLDSHYIHEEDAALRDILLEAKGVKYDDEQGWFMDYPDDTTTLNRFMEQGILTRQQAIRAMDNTDICMDFGSYDDVLIFNKNIKLPTLYPNETKEQKDKRYSILISQKFKEYMKNIPAEDYQKYFDGVKMEVQTYKDTGMSDYPLIDYAIVKDAVEHGGLITDTGRGSAVGYFTNTLCGFSKVDRFKSAIKLYPERFISTTRILETHSLPDIDLNVGTVSIFEDAQKRVLGEEHVAPMIAFGTLKKKSAFKIYAKAQNLPFEIANEVTKELSRYDEAVKNADDEDKDLIDLYDYVDEQYRPYIEQSEKYWGVISDKKKAPSAYLLYQGNIRREIGLIKCKSESTKKEYITCCIDGAIAENYKFLKNDILKVDVVLLIEKVFERIGIEHFNVNTLIEKVKDDQAVWDLYKNGYTIGINQVEQTGSRNKCMAYKPHNISELAAFVAAIRPGFKSMYKRFEQREDFSWGIPSLDNLLRTEELPTSFIFFQEQLMSVLNFAGFPMDECYGIIKAIAKKHPEKVKPLKEKFVAGFRQRLIEDEGLSKEEADDNAENVWQIVNDNCGYGFNSSHAFCMALDSLYQAWQKAHYPYAFYETLLKHYTEKGKKDKVLLLKQEMREAFGIEEAKYRFREDNRFFKADPENHRIICTLASIKSMSQGVANALYNMRDREYKSFFDLLDDLKKMGIEKDQRNILISLNYFAEFGNIKELQKMVDMYEKFGDRKQLKISDLESLGIPEWIADHHGKHTAKMIKDFDAKKLLEEVIANTEMPKTTVIDIIENELDCLGYIQTTVPKAPEDYAYITDISGYSDNILQLYYLHDGHQKTIKYRKKGNPSPQVGNIIKVIDIINDWKWKKLGDGSDDWVRTDDKEEKLTKFGIIR